LELTKIARNDHFPVVSLFRRLASSLFCLLLLIGSAAAGNTSNSTQLKLALRDRAEIPTVEGFSEKRQPLVRIDGTELFSPAEFRYVLACELIPTTEIALGLIDYQVTRNSPPPDADTEDDILSVTVPLPREIFEAWLGEENKDDFSFENAGDQWFVGWWDRANQCWAALDHIQTFHRRIGARAYFDLPAVAQVGQPLLLRWRNGALQPRPEQTFDQTSFQGALSRLQLGEEPRPEDLSLLRSEKDSPQDLLPLAAAWGANQWIAGWSETIEEIRQRSFPRSQDPILLAAQHGHASTVDLLLKAGLEPDRQDDLGFDAGHFAAAGGHTEVLQTLINHGYSLTSRTGDGAYSPMSLAMDTEHDETFGFLWNAGAEIPGFRHSSRHKLLAWHASKGHAQITQYLLEEQKADPNFVTSGGNPVLALAAQAGAGAVVEQLLAAGADPDGNSEKYGLPLLLAASHGHLDVAHRLLEAGADPNASLENGYGALAVAVHRRDRELLELLLGAEADPAAAMPSQSKLGLLELATLAGNRDLVTVLFASGAKCRFAPEQAENILLSAVQNDIPEMAVVAFEECVRPDFRFFNSYGVGWVAERYDAQEIAKWAEEHGLGDRSPPDNLFSSREAQQSPRMLEYSIPPSEIEAYREFGEVKARLRLIIDEEGRARFPVLQGEPLPTEFSISLLQQIEFWRFEPARKDNHPIKTEVILPLNIDFGAKEDVFAESSELDETPRVIHKVHARPPLFGRSEVSRRRLGNLEVLLKIRIAEDGSVSRAEVLSTPHPLLKFAALEAVYEWRFTPPLRNGEPIAANFILPLVFQNR
jgi:TonB family protein